MQVDFRAADETTGIAVSRNNPLPTQSTGTGTNGAQQVEGNVASGAADAGNPVKGGAKYSSILPTYVDGQRTDLQAGVRGALLSSIVDGGGTAQAAVQSFTADGNVLNPAGLVVNARAMVFNGVTEDRARGDITSAFAKPPPLAKTDRSLTLSTTSQQVAAANSTRSRLFVKNNDASISAFINLGAAATTGSGSIEIAAKGIFELTGTNQALNAIAASGTPTLTVWEF